MPSIDRDRNIVRHILKYCDEVNTAHEDFSCSKEKFMSSSTYRNAVTMPILQIGELANHLSDEFKQTYRQIPWNEMRGIRNLMAHQYHSVYFEIIWDTSRGDISALKTFCENYLAQNND